jgi:hypothetical protein
LAHREYKELKAPLEQLDLKGLLGKLGHKGLLELVLTLRGKYLQALNSLPLEILREILTLLKTHYIFGFGMVQSG